jgi:hypothetical protein
MFGLLAIIFMVGSQILLKIHMLVRCLVLLVVMEMVNVYMANTIPAI